VPVYFFTYHAYGTWMPDRARGYTRRGADIRSPDPRMAQRYRENMAETPGVFSPSVQRAMIDELQNAGERQGYQLYAVGSDPTHLHVLVGWKYRRTWLRVRAGLQSSLTRRLNRDTHKRTWFVARPSRKRVKDRSHHDYLIGTYIPNHRGWKWDRIRGLYR